MKPLPNFLIRFLTFCTGIIILLYACQKDDPEPVDLLDRLNAIEGMTAIEIEPNYGYPRAFQIDFEQPIDHQNPGGARFLQRIYLSHSSEETPMIFSPSGYGSTAISVQEIAGIMQTNHLSVVHRFFIEAEPPGMDWTYLTIKQAADDHHRIVEVFKKIYQDKWISTGVSKGGLTSLFHKRFYPVDVDATIAYVSPIEFGTADPRFPVYLDGIGTQECRDRILAFQRKCLVERDSLLPRMMKWLDENNYTISGDPEVVLESNIRSYDWTFWQYHTYDCSEIPGDDSDYDEMIIHLINVTKLYRSSDEMEYYFRPYVYQAFTEIGYPERNYDKLDDLLRFDPDSLFNVSLDYYGIPVIYNPETILDINEWLINYGNNIIYIYGSIDPWTGGEIALEGITNSLKIIQQGGDHHIKIADLDERGLVLQTLGDWLGMDITYVKSKGIQISRIDEHDYLEVVF